MKTQLRMWFKDGETGDVSSEVLEKKEDGLYSPLDVHYDAGSILIQEENVMEEKDFSGEYRLSFRDEEFEDHEIYLDEEDFINMLTGLDIDLAAEYALDLLEVGTKSAIKNFLIAYKKNKENKK